MGNMQRRKRQWREDMRKDGGPVPSAKEAEKRTMALHFRRSMILVRAVTVLAKSKNSIHAIQRKHDGSHAIELANITVSAFRGIAEIMRDATTIK